MPKILRKIGRANKIACQFRFTCTFEYIDLTCMDGWKPEKLHVVWLRGHRRADSPDVQWTPKSDTGNAIDGRATFDPPIATSLIVTLYQTKEGNEFDQKEYKFYIENEGANGKKILASFNCNIADFSGIPSEKHALDMTFKPVSRKINKALLGLTMESEFIKKGRASDDDMMSTFSRVSGTQDDVIGDEDDDDPTMSTSSFQNLPVDTSIASKPPDVSITSNGTDKPADEPPAATSDALVGILKKSSTVDVQSATETEQAISEMKDNQVANDAVQMDTPTLTSQNVVNGATDATSSVLPADNMQQSSFIADVMVSTEVKSKVEGLADGAQSIPSDGKTGQHPPDQKHSSVTVDQLGTEQVPPTTVEVPSVSINQVPVDQVPTVTVDQVPPVTTDQSPPVTVDQAPTATGNQVPPVTTDQIPPVTVDQVPPVISNQVPQPQVNVVPPVTDNQVLPVTTDQVKPDQLSAEQVPTVTSDQGPPIAVDQVLQTTVDQMTAPPVSVPLITIDQVPSVTTNQVPPASGNQTSPVTATAVQVTQAKVNQVPQVTVNQVPVDKIPPVIDNQVPLVADQKFPGAVDQVSSAAVDQTSPVVVPPVTTEQVLPVTVDQGPSVATNQTPSIPSNQKPPDQDTSVKAAVQANPTAPSTDHQDVKQTKKQAQPPAKSAQSKSGKTKKKSAKEDVTPPEASLAAAEASVKSKYIDSPELEDPCWLPDDTPLINSEEQPIAKTALDEMDLIALYFSAEWCPPCKKFMPKLLKFYNYLKQEERKFELVYVSSDNTKEGMLAYMKDQHMPWVGLSFDSPLGEQLRTNFKVAAIPLLVILSRNGEVISDNAKKPVDSASSSHDEITRLYNKWMRKLLEINGIPVPEEEPEKKGGIFSSLFSGGKKKDKKHDKKQQSPPQDATEDHIDEAPPGSKHKEKMNEELLRQKELLEREKSMERQKVEEKTKKLHDTLEINAQMQKELEHKEEKIRILEAKNETLKQTAEAKTNEVEELKQKLAMLETELSSKAAEEKKLQDEKRELLANISLHGWLCKKGAKGPTANTWRRRYFRIEEGSKLTYYKTAGEGPPQGFIDIDKITSVITPPGAQQDKNNCTFHLVTDGRTYELQAHDEATMKKWLSSLQYMKEWRAKQKREAQQ